MLLYCYPPATTNSNLSPARVSVLSMSQIGVLSGDGEMVAAEDYLRD